MARQQRVWGVLAALVALAGLVVAVGSWWQGYGSRSDLVVAAVCSLPAVLALGALTGGRRAVAVTLGTAGLVVGGVAIWSLTADGGLDLYRVTSSPWAALQAGSALVPMPAAAALLLGGAGLWLGGRGPLAASLALAALVVGWFAVVSLAGPVAMADELGFWLDTRALVSAAVLSLAALLLVVLAVASLPVLAGPVRADGPGRAGLRAVPGRFRLPRRALLMAASSMALVVVVTLAVVGWRVWAPRLVLAEVFPDPALAGCVADAVGTADSSAAVSSSDLAQVLSLDCAGGRGGTAVAALTGLDRLEGLAALDLTGNALTDLGPLAELPRLGQLTLTGNRVSDLTPLAGLPVLADLGLSGNAVSDLSPLADVPTLRLLGLADNRVADLTPLSSLSGLTELDLSRNAIGDVAPLAGLLQLDRLELTDNRVSNLGPLSSAPGLTVLDVAGNQVTDVRGLSDHPALTELWLGRNPVTDLTPLLTLPSLTGVDLEGAASTTPGVAELRARGVHVGGFA